MEEWKDIEGYEGLYKVSNLGRVKSLEREVIYSNGSKRIHKERILKLSKRGRGYNSVHLCKNNEEKTYTVARLVAIAFIPNDDPNKTEVDHIIPISMGGTDEVNNLRWVTHKENMNNETTKINRSESMKGEKHPFYKKHLSEEHKRKISESEKGKKIKDESIRKTAEANMIAVICLNTGEIFNSITEASKKMNVDGSAISKCCRGKRKNTKGLRWSYYTE